MKAKEMEKGYEIVWARVVYPNQWWPGLVLRRDFLGVLVSFFDRHHCRYFLPSEVSPFEHNFKSLVDKCTKNVLLNLALKLLGQRVLLSLKRRRSAAGPLFRPRAVLGFVRSMAVSPWVEKDYLLTAVTALAQITAFRHYLIPLGVHSAVTLQANPASVGEMDLVVPELDSLDNNLITGENVGNPLPKESLSSWNKDQLEAGSMALTKQQKIQSLREIMVKLQVLALDPFYLDQECLNSLKSTSLRFRSLTHQSTSVNSCSQYAPAESDNAQLSNPVSITADESIKVHGAEEKTALSVVPYMETPINCLGLKRQLGQYIIPEPPYKLRKTLSFSFKGADAYLWISNKGFNPVSTHTLISGNAFSGSFEFLNTTSFSSIQAYACLLRGITGCEADLFDSFFCGSQVQLKSQYLSSNAAHNSKYICSSSLKELVPNSLNCYLESNTSVHKDIVSVRIVQKTEGNVEALENSRTHISFDDMQQPETCTDVLKDHGTYISYADGATKLLKPPAAPSVSDFEIGTHIDHNMSSDATGRARNYQLHCHLIPDEHKMLPSNGDNSYTVKRNEEISMSVGLGYSSEENKDLLQPDTSDSAFKSKVGRQPEVQSTVAISRSLLIKFPKDFSLPSKEELVKKFHKFGRIDILETKIFFYSGSARVVFFHQLDAVAAYQYAKRKKISFGKADVKIWLVPSEDRRATKSLFSFPSCTAQLPRQNLKSCLKKPKPLEKEDKRSPRKVRFLMEISET